MNAKQWSFSRGLFLVIFSRQVGRVKYHWGAKAGDLWRDSQSITLFDCSGAMQYWMFRSSYGGVVFPEGSAEQHEYCIANGWKPCDYNDVIANEDDARFFICFLQPTGEHPGHVWLVSNRKTYECCGSLGVANRTPTLTFPAKCDACYEVPTAF